MRPPVWMRRVDLVARDYHDGFRRTNPASRLQHVRRPRDVDLVGTHRVCEGRPHEALCRHVEHDLGLDRLDALRDCGSIPNIYRLHGAS